jgi:RNA polymerase sigma factor (sigma-70 family)
MTTAPLGTLLRHIQKLSARPRAPERTDRQLLEDFAARRDEYAFTALVARHGPMVLRVCRRVLNHEQDAEDAFQATFLVLARNTALIRKREAVADWLHGVAHRTAMKAKRSAARRRNHEARRRALTPEAVPGPRWDEVQAVLDEEIRRLPEPFRAAFTLCVLEGKSGPQAAAELGCKEGTVASRLARARERLRQQLARRGIQLSALLAALAVAESAGRAAVPVTLVQATVRFGLLVAAGEPVAGVIPPHVAALAAGVTRAMSTKTKIALVVLLAVGLFAAGAASRTQRVTADETAKPPAATSAGPPAAEAKPPADDKDSLAYGGRVLGPDGKPVAGAKLYLTPTVIYPNRPSSSPENATTDPDGRFTFTVPKAQFGDRYTFVAATASGCGIGLATVPPSDRRDGLTLRLVADDVPITGQVVDLEGKPVPGATLTVLIVSAAPGEDLGPWLEAVKAGKGLKGQGLQSCQFPLSPQVTTDVEGRFRLAGVGIGRNRLIRARLDGPAIASQQLHILTRPGKPIEGKEYKGQPGAATYYGADFRHVAGPCKPIVGTVRDKDTGKPLAGVTVESNMLANNPVPGMNIVQTATDAEGRYRLTGMPKGEGNKIRLVPRDDQPYVSVHALVPNSPGLDPVTVDFELKRGVWIEGKLTDKATGKPAQGYVDYFALPDNPNVRDHPGFDGTVPPYWGVATKEDGSYRIVGLPGPGLVAVFYDGQHLLAPERDDEYGIKEPTLFTAPRPLGLTVNYTALARLDPAKGIDSVKRDVTLDPGWTFTGTVLGPDGKPLAGARGFGLTARGWYREALPTAEFTVRAFNPRGPREVLFQHPEKGLVGVLQPPKENGASVPVRLEPGATVTGRLIDADGKPRAGVELDVMFRLKGRTGWFEWSEYSPERIKTDGEGRFRIEALLPGYEFRLRGEKGELRLGGLSPGQTKDLGDVEVKPIE